MADDWEREDESCATLPHKLRRVPWLVWWTILGAGREDPRRTVHSLKVGLALVLISLLYLIEQLYQGIRWNAIWAVMTVVVVLEFTVWATLCKGLNRGLGTLLAGSLAFFIEYVSHETSHVVRAVFVGSAVFLIGPVSTYMRFFPYIKKDYDYGVVIFLMTFNLITVSSNRVKNVLKIAHQRFYTIAIGCTVCLLMSLMVFPYWWGEDLHNSTISMFEELARSIDACVAEYFSEARIDEERKEESSEDPIYKGFKTVMDLKANDEALVSPVLGIVRKLGAYCISPWHQYVKLGAVLRHFNYTVVALHGCLGTEIQTPLAVRTRVAGEVTKVLVELASNVRNHRHCSLELLSDHLHESMQDFNNAIKSQPKLFLRSNNSKTSNMLALVPAAQSSRCGEKKGKGQGRKDDSRGRVSLSSVKIDTSTLFEWKTKQAAAEQHPIWDMESEWKVLWPQLSKIAITRLEFSKALPFAAFASLVVETVARLDLVIEEVEELGRLACFKEYKPEDEINIKCEQSQARTDIHHNHLPSHVMD